MLMVTLFVSILVIDLLRGNKHFPSLVGIKTCSVGDWLLLATIFGICILAFLLTVRMIRQKHALKERVGYKFHHADLKYDDKTIIKLSILGVCGGISGGCLGIGGGMIFNPMLMDMGMLPEVASASGMYLVLYSSASTILQFAINGKINWFYSLWLCLWSSLGTATGMLLIGKLVQKSGRSSYIILCLITLIVMSAVILPVDGIFNIIAKMDKGEDVIAFKSLCK